MIYLQKGGEFDLRKAGECFSLAGCYELAAEAYAKGNLFAECLSACYEGKCFNNGIRYIEYWKQQSASTDDVTERYKDLDKIEQNFSESCAKYYHKNSHNVSMMKYVRSFQTMELKRNFLKSMDCFEDLYFLEEDLANFMEAQEVLKLLGDLNHEINRLRKGKCFRDASLFILAYILSCSLWGFKSNGWPLKSFPQKEYLESKAISIAEEEDSIHFNEFVREVVKVLSHEQSNVFELIQCFRTSRKHKCLMGEFLSVRKLLDAHFQVHPSEYEWEQELPVDLKKHSEEIFLQNQVTATTLFYIWNVFKNNILDVLESLDCLEREDFSECKHTVEFCLNYFGVRRLSNNINVTYLLLNPDAKWVESIDERFGLQNGKAVTLDTRCIVSASRTYWRGELVSIGMRALEALGGLYKTSVVESLSGFCQSTCLTCMFDMVKFFIDSKSLVVKSDFPWALNSFVELSFRYFEIVFSLDSQSSLSENMISIRGTTLSQNLLEEVITRNISRKNELTYGQIGEVVMI